MPAKKRPNARPNPGQGRTETGATPVNPRKWQPVYTGSRIFRKEFFWAGIRPPGNQPAMRRGTSITGSARREAAKRRQQFGPCVSMGLTTPTSHAAAKRRRQLCNDHLLPPLRGSITGTSKRVLFGGMTWGCALLAGARKSDPRLYAVGATRLYGISLAATRSPGSERRQFRRFAVDETESPRREAVKRRQQLAPCVSMGLTPPTTHTAAKRRQQLCNHHLLPPLRGLEPHG